MQQMSNKSDLMLYLPLCAIVWRERVFGLGGRRKLRLSLEDEQTLFTVFNVRHGSMNEVPAMALAKCISLSPF